MNILDGLINFLTFVNNNWTSIGVLIGLIIILVQRIYSFITKSTDEQIETVKAQIQEIMLRMVTEAELDYADWNKAGEIKRSQVIEQIFSKFPILSKITDQENLIVWLDELIDDALVTLRSVIETNSGDSNMTISNADDEETLIVEVETVAGEVDE